jgi:hypothetical protein
MATYCPCGPLQPTRSADASQDSIYCTSWTLYLPISTIIPNTGAAEKVWCWCVVMTVKCSPGERETGGMSRRSAGHLHPLCLARSKRRRDVDGSRRARVNDEDGWRRIIYFSDLRIPLPSISEFTGRNPPSASAEINDTYDGEQRTITHLSQVRQRVSDVSMPSNSRCTRTRVPWGGKSKSAMGALFNSIEPRLYCTLRINTKRRQANLGGQQGDSMLVLILVMFVVLYLLRLDDLIEKVVEKFVRVFGEWRRPFPS